MIAALRPILAIAGAVVAGCVLVLAVIFFLGRWLIYRDQTDFKDRGK